MRAVPQGELVLDSKNTAVLFSKLVDLFLMTMVDTAFNYKTPIDKVFLFLEITKILPLIGES